MTPNQTRLLRIQSSLLIGVLIIQYMLGMYINLFISFPDGARDGVAWEFAWHTAAIATHIVLGIFLLLGSIAFLVRAIRYQSTVWRTPAIWGLVGIIAAGASGATFIATQLNSLSYIMGISFLVAFFSYVWGIAAARREV